MPPAGTRLRAKRKARCLHRLALPGDHWSAYLKCNGCLLPYLLHLHLTPLSSRWQEVFTTLSFKPQTLAASRIEGYITPVSIQTIERPILLALNFACTMGLLRSAPNRDQYRFVTQLLVGSPSLWHTIFIPYFLGRNAWATILAMLYERIFPRTEK